MRVYGQEKIPLWDDAYTWEYGLQSFKHLRRLLVRTSHAITTSSSESDDGLGCLRGKMVHQREQEDNVVRRWLTFLPPSLTEVQIWTKAFAGRANGERMAVWMYSERRGFRGWEVVRNHPIEGEEVCGGSFI